MGEQSTKSVLVRKSTQTEESCCQQIKNCINNGVFEVTEESNLGIVIRAGDTYYGIDYCPFCGEKVKVKII